MIWQFYLWCLLYGGPFIHPLASHHFILQVKKYTCSYKPALQPNPMLPWHSQVQKFKMVTLYSSEESLKSLQVKGASVPLSQKKCHWPQQVYLDFHPLFSKYRTKDPCVGWLSLGAQEISASSATIPAPPQIQSAFWHVLPSFLVHPVSSFHIFLPTLKNHPTAWHRNHYLAFVVCILLVLRSSANWQWPLCQHWISPHWCWGALQHIQDTQNCGVGMAGWGSSIRLLRTFQTINRLQGTICLKRVKSAKHLFSTAMLWNIGVPRMVHNSPQEFWGNIFISRAVEDVGAPLTADVPYQLSKT